MSLLNSCSPKKDHSKGGKVREHKRKELALNEATVPPGKCPWKTRPAQSTLKYSSEATQL